ncbi:MAG TPA: hypothetical protein VFA94_16755 [Acidimicrobiales bacterium]|nr:hypothetical protein [Acidimicrobiales bacterium]
MWRGAGALALAASALLVGFGGSPAQAASTLPITGTSWYWSEQVKPIGVVCPPPPLPQDPSQCVAPPGQVTALPAPDVPDGDLAVAAKNDGIDKVTALHIDLGAVPLGSTVKDATLRLVEDAKAGNINNTTNPKIIATPTDYFADGANANPLDQAPNMEQQPQTQGARTLVGTDGVWTFDITGQLNACLATGDPACGVGLRPPFTQGGSFEVVWFGLTSKDPTFTEANKPTVTATVVAGTEVTTTTVTVPLDTTPTQPSVTTSPPSDQQFTPGFVSVGSPLPATSATSTSTTTTPPKTGTAAPRIRRAAHVGKAPPLAFFLAALGLAALVGSSMVALGDAGEPVPARRGSVVQALERRGRASPVE